MKNQANIKIKKAIGRSIKQIEADAQIIGKTETTNFIEDNFNRESYAGKAWQIRDVDKNPQNYSAKQVANSRGRKILYGAQNDPNREGEHLRDSFEITAKGLSITVESSKPYAQRHNNGEDGMPERRFIGNSKRLINNIKTKLISTLKRR